MTIVRVTNRDIADNVLRKKINDLIDQFNADVATGIYGGVYCNAAATNIAVAASSTDYDVTGLSTGLVAGVTFQNAKELKILTAGHYDVKWSISFDMASGSNIDIEGAVMINSTRQVQTVGQRRIGTGTDIGNMGGCGVLNCAVGDVVKMVVRNDTDTNDILIQHANMVIQWIGA